jgi:hypothetical protein
VAKRLTQILTRIAFGAMLLRVLVPAGYMPSDLDDGWYLKLCPDGMPVSVMVALFGHEHQHHHHPNAQGGAAAPEITYAQCDLGGTLSADIDATAHVAVPASEAQLPLAAAPLDQFFHSRSVYSHRPRGPPAPV